MVGGRSFDAPPTRGMRAPRGASGFTLLELLVVMVIIGVLAGMVSLSVSGRAVEDRMQAESRRMMELVRLASDEAQAKGIEIGLRQTVEGMQFLTLDERGRWTVVREGLFRPRQVPPPFMIELRVDGRLVKPVVPEPPESTDTKSDASLRLSRDDDARAVPEPQVLILSSGEMTPFALDVRLPDSAVYYRVEANALGALTSARQEPRA